MSSDSFFNSQMQQYMQQFYLTVDSSLLTLPSESQSLYSSTHTATNERYYFESSANVQGELSQAPEPSFVVTENPASESLEVPYSQPLYRGEKQVSKRGSNFVIVYEIPESQLCYTFQHQKKAKREGYIIYRCTGCKLQNDAYTSVQIKDDVFDEDPCMLLHNCLPLDRYGDKANRAGYEACQKLRKDKQAYRTTPYRHYTEAAQSILTDTWKTIEDRRKALGKFHGKGYEQRRKTFSKASNAQKRTVDPSNVPEDLSHVPGGDLFLQLQTDDLHLYFCTDIVEKARDNGMYALIGDGVHNLNPVTIPNRMDKGQLYVLHAAIQGGIEVPILYAVTRYKTVDTYKTIFEKLRETLGDYNDRFILDFEKAAIRAARETFPQAKVQGCAFHLAQAWNRMSVNLGLRKFVRGPKAILAVKKWVTALISPPVSETHIAHGPCEDFLNYLNRNYFNGTFEGIWCKWDLREYRTTNTAEAFHSKLRGMLSRRINPPFEELLECLHGINSMAFGALYNASENASACRILRKKDQDRRQKIDQAMDEFKQLYLSSEVLETEVIENYCSKMSKFVSEKTI